MTLLETAPLPDLEPTPPLTRRAADFQAQQEDIELFHFPTMEELARNERGDDDDLAALVADIWNAEPETSTDFSIFDIYAPQIDEGDEHELRFRTKFVAKALGFIASGTTVLVGAGLLASALLPSSGESVSLGEKIKPSESTEVITDEYLEIPTTSTTVGPTTTEAPRPVEFKVNDGDLIGVLKIPAICIDDIQIVQYSTAESPLVGKGGATLDRKIIDPTPSPENCERIDQQTEDYLSRGERIRPSAVTPENPEGFVDALLPIAGFASTGGLPVTPYPGSPGNTVIAAHGSTYSAAFADVPALIPGDVAEIDRVDGRTYTYELIGHEILPPGAQDPYVRYSHPENPSTLTLYLCSDAEGNTGSSAQRYTTRWVLRSITTK